MKTPKTHRFEDCVFTHEIKSHAFTLSFESVRHAPATRPYPLVLCHARTAAETVLKEPMPPAVPLFNRLLTLKVPENTKPHFAPCGAHPCTPTTPPHPSLFEGNLSLLHAVPFKCVANHLPCTRHYLLVDIDGPVGRPSDRAYLAGNMTTRISVMVLLVGSAGAFAPFSASLRGTTIPGSRGRLGSAVPTGARMRQAAKLGVNKGLGLRMSVTGDDVVATGPITGDDVASLMNAAQDGDSAKVRRV